MAALSVGISHHLTVLPNTGASPYVRSGRIVWALHASPAYLLFAAHEAVILFFVLSGFVLFLPWANGGSVPYYGFLVRRWARIYIPYIFAAVAAFVMRSLFYRGPLPELSLWANQPWVPPIGAPVLFGHVFLIGVFDYGRLAPVFWTLVQEMRVAFVFPLMALLTLRLDWRATLSGAFAVSITAIYVHDHVTARTVQDLLATVHYAALFVVGSLLARFHTDLVSRWRKASAMLRRLLILVALALYAYGRAASHLLFGLGDWAAAFAVAVFFIAVLESARLTAALNSRIPQFLGRVSYSYYLLHTVVLLSILHVAEGSHFPLAAALMISFVLGLLVAPAAYRFVELPAIRLGRSLSAPLMSANFDKSAVR